jgi:serine/threonine protein kinase
VSARTKSFLPLEPAAWAKVYRARDTRLDRTVAIKVLPSHVSADPALREGFEREARAIAALNHPHICTLHDVGRHEDTDYLVLEYLEGQTLADRLSKSALPVDQTLAIAIHIADAPDKAHRAGIVHRDLKPGNVMLTKSGAKLLDFGLAKMTPAVVAAPGLSMAPTGVTPMTAQGPILGTLQYMAPEQVEGREADARSDIFTFGAIVYEMVTGHFLNIRPRRSWRRSLSWMVAAFLLGGSTAAAIVWQLTRLDPPRLTRLAITRPPLSHSLLPTAVPISPSRPTVPTLSTGRAGVVQACWSCAR